MPSSAIRYDLLVQDALRGMVRDLLTKASREGMPGDHHFYVTFKTHAPGVQLSARMKAQYPDEITIVLQHQFWDLSVSERQFEVGLSFSNVPERLIVPFSALTGFHDPIAPFTLKFEPSEEPAQSPAPSSTQAPSLAPSLSPALAPRAQPRPVARLAEKQADESADQSGEATRAAGQPQDAAPTERKADAPAAAPVEGEAKVVSIDAFRKKT